MRNILRIYSKMLWLTFTMLCTLVLVSLAGCENEPSVKVNLQNRVAMTPPVNESAITYAYLPQYAHAASFARHGALVEYLQKVTGLPVRQVYPDTFDAHIEMIESGKIDISFVNPMACVALQGYKKGAFAAPFAKIVEPSGKALFSGNIIVRSDNKEINSLEDCKGKSWIATDPLSAGGFLFALGMFKDAGINEDDFSDIAFTPGPGGKQEKAVMGVYAGLYDFASVREGTLELMRPTIESGSMRVLATTPAYPSWVFMARHDLEPSTLRRIKEAFFALSYENVSHRKILQLANIKEIIPTDGSEYASVYDLVRRVGKLDILGELRKDQKNQSRLRISPQFPTSSKQNLQTSPALETVPTLQVPTVEANPAASL